MQIGEITNRCLTPSQAGDCYLAFNVGIVEGLIFCHNFSLENLPDFLTDNAGVELGSRVPSHADDERVTVPETEECWPQGGVFLVLTWSRSSWIRSIITASNLWNQVCAALV